MAPSRIERRCRVRGCCTLAMAMLSIAPAGFGASTGTNQEMEQILERLDRLEAQNRALSEELESVKKELATVRGAAPEASAPIQERLDVEEARTAEQAQSKVGASQRFPLRITGMALFNSYRNSSNAGGAAFPTVAAASGSSGGATFRQTIIGLDYDGPTIVGGGKVHGSAQMDFYGGSGSLLDQTFRIRTADIVLDWNSRSFTAALDKPLISQRDPESLAQVGVSPLTGAGNLWLWVPQAKFEQDFRFGEESGIRAQVAAVATHEISGFYGGGYAPTLPAYVSAEGPSRPAVEGRLEFFHGTGNRIEIAPGFHRSVSHIADASAPSDIYSVDWLARTGNWLEFTGTAFTGLNTAPIGGLQQGVAVIAPGVIHAVHSTGGWGQVKLRPASRVWFNLFSGEEDPKNRQLGARAISRNLAYGANVFFQLAPNVLASFEVYQYRTGYIRAPGLLTNHYDLALAYRF